MYYIQVAYQLPREKGPPRADTQFETTDKITFSRRSDLVYSG